MVETVVLEEYEDWSVVVTVVESMIVLEIDSGAKQNVRTANRRYLSWASLTSRTN